MLVRVMLKREVHVPCTHVRLPEVTNHRKDHRDLRSHPRARLERVLGTASDKVGVGCIGLETGDIDVVDEATRILARVSARELCRAKQGTLQNRNSKRSLKLPPPQAQRATQKARDRKRDTERQRERQRQRQGWIETEIETRSTKNHFSRTERALTVYW